MVAFFGGTHKLLLCPNSKVAVTQTLSDQAMTSRAFSKPSRVGEGSEKLLVTRVITSRVVNIFFDNE